MRKIKVSLARTLAAALVLGLGAQGVAFAQHPQAEPLPGPTGVIRTPAAVPGVPPFDPSNLPATRFDVNTPTGIHPQFDTREDPPGTNFLPTVYENYRLPNGTELINTVPSTPDGKYNLHDGPVTVKSIRRDSPQSDMLAQIEAIEGHLAHEKSHGNSEKKHVPFPKAIQNAIDILEGNVLNSKYLPDRVYSGQIAMLHYTGPLKRKLVEPIYDPQTNQVIGGNVDINLYYYEENIESDTSMIDPSLVLDVPWTMTYRVHILKNGIEDFSPFTMYFDNPDQNALLPVRASSAGIAMDQSYFPMLKEGTRYTVKIKMAPGKHYSLTYVWGWRIHPPRVVVIENATKIVPVNAFGMGRRTTLLEQEQQVFGVNPRANEAAKLAAIGMIGDLAPAKRMWKDLRDLRDLVDDDDDEGEGEDDDSVAVAALVADLRASYLDWISRRHLPRGVEVDPNADLTMVYLNNTIYGQMPKNVSGQGSNLGPEAFKGVMQYTLNDWHTRGYTYNVKLLNGDNFPHMYVNVDFGGQRGWENLYQFTDPTTVIDEETGEPLLPHNRGGIEEFLASDARVLLNSPGLGSGCFFTFGRVHYWVNAGPPVGAFTMVMPGMNGQLGQLDVSIKLNFEPTMRLRVYQFDPFHHEQAVFSLH
jgi:hypothetical protein